MNLKSRKHVLFLAMVLIKTRFSFKIEVDGELSLSWKLLGLSQKLVVEDNKQELEKLPKIRNVTVAAMMECPYQYPDLDQFNMMLSNMMNELTKVLVRAHQMLDKEQEWRRQHTRFRVVDHRESEFFEDIFTNMTQEYRQMYDSTSLQVSRTRDPCERQEEIKQLWRDLLETSVTSLRKASLQCIDEFLKIQKRSEDRNTRSKLHSFLMGELAKIRNNQLQALCDHFQLCYSELL